MDSLTVFLQQAYFGLVHGAIYVMIASGLTLLFGVVGVVNMAHGELAMLGGMLTYSLMEFLHFPFAFAVIVAVIAVASSGIILSRVAILPVLRVSALMPLLSTFAVSMILVHGAVRIWGTLPRLVDAPFAVVFRPGGVAVSGQSLMLLAVCAVTMASLHLLITRTKLGKMMRAVQQNPRAAEVIGLNTRRVHDTAVVIASGMAALAGIFILAVAPYSPHMGQPLLLFGFAVVIVAGMGHVPGAVVVGFTLGVAESLFGQYVSTYFRSAFIYSLMAMVLIVRPPGLFGRR